MSGGQLSTPRIFYSFLWRGALIGIAGGIAVPVLTVQLLVALVLLLNPDAGVPLLVRLGAPGGALIGVLAAYASIRLDGTNGLRIRALYLGYIGFLFGGFYGSLGAILVLTLGFVVITGPVAGVVAGMLIATVAAGIVRFRFRPLRDAVDYERFMRRCLAALGLIVGAVTWMAVLGGVYGIWSSEELQFVAPWIGIGLFAGLVSGAFACCTSICLTDWYSRASQGLPSVFESILRDLPPTTTPSGGSI